MAGLFERMQVIGSQSKPGAQKRFNIIEMHSRKSQGYRTGASEKFRVGKGIMMFSSDVTARGMDYPDVSMVLQVRSKSIALLGAPVNNMTMCVSPTIVHSLTVSCAHRHHPLNPAGRPD